MNDIAEYLLNEIWPAIKADLKAQGAPHLTPAEVNTLQQGIKAAAYAAFEAGLRTRQNEVSEVIYQSVEDICDLYLDALPVDLCHDLIRRLHRGQIPE